MQACQLAPRRDGDGDGGGDGAVIELLTALAEEALDEKAPNVSKQTRNTFTEQVPGPEYGPGADSEWQSRSEYNLKFGVVDV